MHVKWACVSRPTSGSSQDSVMHSHFLLDYFLRGYFLLDYFLLDYFLPDFFLLGYFLPQLLAAFSSIPSDQSGSTSGTTQSKWLLRVLF
ncbi:unnamed protein product [Gadus morhua 'NCC']